MSEQEEEEGKKDKFIGKKDGGLGRGGGLGEYKDKFENLKKKINFFYFLVFN